MARYRYVGGDQRPDVYGVLTPGDVLEFAQVPDWGAWEPTSDDAERAPTAQPSYIPAGPESAGDEPASPPPADGPDDTAKEA